MTGAAEVRLSGRNGVFCADVCRVDGLAVFASGRWRYRLGANNAAERYGERRSYTWHLSRCDEIRWTAEVAS